WPWPPRPGGRRPTRAAPANGVEVDPPETVAHPQEVAAVRAAVEDPRPRRRRFDAPAKQDEGVAEEPAPIRRQRRERLDTGDEGMGSVEPIVERGERPGGAGDG